MKNPIDKFRHDWRRDADIAELCVGLYLHLSKKEHRLEHFSFAQLKKATKTKNDKKLAQALQYLSSPKWEILRQIFFFFDNDGDTYEFSPEEMSEFYEENAFAHPVSGQVIEDLNQIQIAFEAGSFFGKKPFKKSNEKHWGSAIR